MCEVLPAIHALSGCDTTSKFGTKAAAIKADPIRYLKDFGQAQINVEASVPNAERYLVQVLHRGDHGIETMDCLRHHMFLHRQSTSLIDLPPTSSATSGGPYLPWFLRCRHSNILSEKYFAQSTGFWVHGGERIFGAKET